MPVIIEEITGEVAAERGAEQPRQASREPRLPGGQEERLRALLVREQRRAERLSDR